METETIPGLIPTRGGPSLPSVCAIGGASSQIDPVSSDPVSFIAPGRYNFALVNRAEDSPWRRAPDGVPPRRCKTGVCRDRGTSVWPSLNSVERKGACGRLTADQSFRNQIPVTRYPLIVPKRAPDPASATLVH
jgi:hypothetical protein